MFMDAAARDAQGAAAPPKTRHYKKLKRSEEIAVVYFVVYQFNV